jgi:O-antigen/teichoic acid export membrane protein
MAGIKIIKDISTVGGADTFGTVMSAVFWFYLASQIEPSSYGEIHWFLGLASLFSGIALFGTVNTLTVYTAKKTQIQSTLNFISLSASVISSLIVIVLFPSFYTIDVGIILIAYVINALAIGDLLGRKQYSNYSKYTLIQKGLTLGLGFSFFYFFGYESIIFALALSYVLHFKRIFSIFKEMKINFNLIKPRIGFIINNYFMSILAIASGQVDKIVVAPLLGFSILGNYSLAVQAVNIMLILPSVFYKYLLPQESTGVKNKKPKIIIVIFSIFITIFGIFVVPALINEFFPKFDQAVDAIRIMSIVVIPTTVSLIFESEFLGNEKSRIVVIGTVIVLSSLIIGMIVLGSLMGIEGIAYSLVIANTAKVGFYLIVKKFSTNIL